MHRLGSSWLRRLKAIYRVAPIHLFCRYVAAVAIMRAFEIAARSATLAVFSGSSGSLRGSLWFVFPMGFLSCFNTWSECFGHTRVFNWRKPITICSINSKTSVESAMQLRVQWAAWMNVTCSFPRERSRNVPKQIAAGGKFGFLPLEANLCAKHDIPVCLARRLLQW